MVNEATSGNRVRALSKGDVAAFADRLAGDLILPDDDRYDDARETWNGLIDTRPAVVTRVRNSEDVAAALAFADDHDLPSSIRGNAHHQAGSALVEDGLVVDLADLTAVDVDPDERIAHVEPGLTPGDALAETLDHGLAFPTGSAASVGISGSTLGGGIGWMRGAHGLGVDALREVELVTAAGDVLTASEDTNPDLFRAVKGAGANFGVVTRLSFDLYDVGPEVQSLGVFYPLDEADTVLEAYRRLDREAPPELTTMLLNGETPHLPDLPADLQGVPAVAIMGCYVGDHDAGETAVAPFTEIADPILDMSGVVPYAMLHELGADMFPEGDYYCQRSVFVDELTDDHLEIVETATEDAPSSGNGVGVWSLGGAVGSGSPNSLPWDDANYLLTVEGHWLDETTTDANVEWVRGIERDLRDAGGDHAYAGFVGLDEHDDESWADLVYGEEYDFLADVKAEYDPENRFATNVNVEPAN